MAYLTTAELIELGATVRYAQLQREIDELVRNFPNLKDMKQAWKELRAEGQTQPKTRTVRKRKRRKMSAAARAKISAAQKARWAKQRKAAK